MSSEKPLSTSYPFLDFARRRGLDYGMVLSCADAMQRDIEIYCGKRVRDGGLTIWEATAVLSFERRDLSHIRYLVSEFIELRDNVRLPSYEKGEPQW